MQAATGLRVYFDKALKHCLLYDHEIEECEKVGYRWCLLCNPRMLLRDGYTKFQLPQVLADGIAPSSLYGGEHLLRLCAKLPYLIPISSAPQEAYATLQEQLAAFVAFLSNHQTEFFISQSK